MSDPRSHSLRECAYPHGDPLSPDFHFCKAPVQPGFSYCRPHLYACTKESRHEDLTYFIEHGTVRRPIALRAVWR